MPRACPACGETAWKKEIFSWPPDLAVSAPLRLIECSSCGLVYLPVIPPAQDLYATGYYGQRRGPPRWIFEPFNRFWTQRKARRLLSLGSGRSWLDYGCGRGDLLEALFSLGADVYGIETQLDCAELLNARWKKHAGQRLTDLELAPDTLNGIAFYHVLEHLDDPHEILRQLHPLSRPDAVMFITVPHWNSWERMGFGDRWFHLDVPRHVQHFSPATLSVLLERAGWRTQAIHFNVRAYDLYGLFQSLLNLGPGPRNYFYRRFKRGESFEGSRGWVGLAWNLLAVLPAAGIALLLAPLLACLKRTGTFEVTATRAAHV